MLDFSVVRNVAGKDEIACKFTRQFHDALAHFFALIGKCQQRALAPRRLCNAIGNRAIAQ
jgi:hypothetical protein